VIIVVGGRRTTGVTQRILEIGIGEHLAQLGIFGEPIDHLLPELFQPLVRDALSRWSQFLLDDSFGLAPSNRDDISSRDADLRDVDDVPRSLLLLAVVACLLILLLAAGTHY
jgi:hypothetical protein